MGRDSSSKDKELHLMLKATKDKRANMALRVNMELSGVKD